MYFFLIKKRLNASAQFIAHDSIAQFFGGYNQNSSEIFAARCDKERIKASPCAWGSYGKKLVYFSAREAADQTSVFLHDNTINR